MGNPGIGVVNIIPSTTDGRTHGRQLRGKIDSWPPETRATQVTLSEALDLLANTIERLMIEVSPSVEITGIILDWSS